jgi:hypothetical protein
MNFNFGVKKKSLLLKIKIMKTKITTRLMILLLITLTAIGANAQQSSVVRQESQMPAYVSSKPATGSYTYKVFQAPNKNFGYDILLNGKLVYHEFASMNQPENANAPLAKNLNAPKLKNTDAAFAKRENLALSKKEHAEKAALLAIEKMKRREAPVLSQDEVRKIVSQ